VIIRPESIQIKAITPAIRHDILVFCERELVTLGREGIEKKMAIIALIKPRCNHHTMSTFHLIFSSKYVLSLTSLNTFTYEELKVKH